MLGVMPVSLDFLRGVLGVLCIFFGHLSGRSAAAVRKGRQKLSRFYGWVIRAAVCGIAVSLRFRVDTIDIAVWVLCVAAFVLGWWEGSREKKPEDLTRQIFGE
jgi:hypothetical protein